MIGVIPSVSRNLFCRSGVPAAILVILLLAVPAFARSKNRSTGYVVTSQIQQLDAALKSNDVESAQAIATAHYAQATDALALTSTDPTVIIDPSLVTTQSVEFTRTKVAYDIAACFYRHAELDIARQWATTTTTGGTLGEEYVRRATVLLGNIATAMDKDDEAVADFTSVISLANLNPEQPAAYAGLLEVLMLQKQDDLVAQWVQRGQTQFAGAGDLELAFLKETAKTLKRRNNPLWNELDQQIVGLSSSSAGNKLNALRQLASNARKFGRWAEAETNYAAICAMPQTSPQDTVNSFLFLAECQAKQGKDFTAALQRLQQKSTDFTDATEKEYATYRAAKFYDEQGNFDSAATNYQLLVSSSSTSTWVAASLHQLGALKEKQGDLRGALQLYLRYPQRFPQNQRLAVQAYGSALNVATALEDTNRAEQIVSAITNNTAAIQDYNTQLNLAFYFHKRGRQQIAESYLEGGLLLARRTLSQTNGSQDRSLIHYRTLQRLSDFAQYQRMVDYFAANASDLPGAIDSSADAFKLQCYAYKAFALNATGNRQGAVTLFQELLDQVHGNSDLETKFDEDLGLLYDWSRDDASAAQLFEAAAQSYPTHPWANIGRLRLAALKFNAGDFAGAMKLTDDITNTLPENSKMTWIRRTYWSAVYIRGCCLQAQGRVSQGASLKQLALLKQTDLPIVHRLVKP